MKKKIVKKNKEKQKKRLQMFTFWEVIYGNQIKRNLFFFFKEYRIRATKSTRKIDFITQDTRRQTHETIETNFFLLFF